MGWKEKSMTTFGDQVFQFGGQAVASDGYPGDYAYTAAQTEGARTYYVNNITGSTNYDGLSWRWPKAEVSQAITASEAHRATLTTNNQDVRNRIFVQGTATAYAALTALPLHCDLIGIGDHPYGNGDGIVRIGADSGVDVGGAICTATVRGLHVENIQFQMGGNSYAMQFANVFRSSFKRCGFFTSGSPAGTPAAGFRVTGAAGGLLIEDCHWGSNSNATNFATIGLHADGTYWHNCIVRDCYIAGDTGVKIDSTCINTFGSIFRNNYIGYGGETCNIGVDDDDTDGHTIYAGNYIFATTALDLENNGSGRAVGNFAANDFVAAS
jgi:hypothetical protein